MYRKCVTEISVQHQRQIEEALLELMGKMPFSEITVTQLCQSAQVTRRVFYHLFTGKTDALHALVDHRILECEGYRTDLADPALRFFLYWQDQKKLLDGLDKSSMHTLLLERMISSVLKEDYDVRSWLKADDPEDGTDILIFKLSGILSLVHRWHFSGYRKSPEQMAKLLNQIMVNPLSK